MTLSYIELKDSLNKAYRLIKPRRDDLDRFKSSLLHLLNNVDEKESEENVKIHLMDFLKNTFYHPNHLIATKGKTDFVIHLDRDAKSHAGVLFEVKKPTNRSDMVTKNNLNAKAMHELILYFFRERQNNKNISLTHLIITNIYEWYIFDAAQFDKIFVQNTQLQKAYREWEAGQKVSTSTDLFYKEIVKPFLHELDKEITYAHFDIREYIPSLKSSKEKDDKKLIALYKFFTPIHLLKLPFINDSNSLDKGFFNELLHIIGLEEVKDGSRKIIRRLPENRRNPGSLLENAINILEVEGAVRKVSRKNLYGQTQEEQLFNLSLELCITWVNRILFLKLLEAQLLKYHAGSSEYKFLNVSTVRDYDELYKLFFQVLAKQTSERTPLIKQKYSHIPYLNSSLFEISELESETIKINGLDDNLDIELYSNTILGKKAKLHGGSSINTLHYFFRFLDAYDFASIGKEEVQEENKPIINAAVLGLVFEKINGYRDGSIYTPGAVTMFLCRETIRRSLVKKFNDAYSWKCESVGDIKNHLADQKNQNDILRLNKLVDSVKIADIAVGSGHFLVSALNEIIAIKAELGILADNKGSRLSDIEVAIVNDELVVTYHNTKDFFEYAVSKDAFGTHRIPTEMQKVQETLFNEKRKIIEHCLFGVDINPNSVKICQLRLWIELLKHAYYRAEEDYTELETLPNIDINIKQGNSLLSKYPLDEDLSDVLKKNRFGVFDYKLAVDTYKEAPNNSKDELRSFFTQIKKQFHETVSRRDPKRKRLSDLRGQLALANSNFDLFGQKQSDEKKQADVARLTLSIDKIEKEISEIETNAIYRNAFEWRFEFPEIWDDAGNFEGFDAILGNPPYIQLQKMGADADALQKGEYKTFVRTGDIYCLFYELAVRLLKPGYFFGFITSNKWMRASYGEATRRFFLEETNPVLLVDFGGYQVFDSATVDTNLLISQKANYEGVTQTCLLDKNIGSLEKMSDYIRQHATIYNGFSTGEGWVILGEIEARIKRKIECLGTPLHDWEIKINYGIKTGYNDAFIIDGAKRDELLKNCPKAAEIIRPILKGRNLRKYSPEFANLWIIFTRRGLDIKQYPEIENYLFKFYKELKPRTSTDTIGRKPGNYKWYEIQDNVAYYEDFSKEKILWIELSDSPKFSYDTDGYYAEATTFIMTGKHLKYLTAFLNSKLCDWYFDKITTTSGVGTNRWKKVYIENLPIPKPGIKSQKFDELLDEIRAAIANDAPVGELNDRINREVLNLYDFSEEEIEILHGFRHS